MTVSGPRVLKSTDEMIMFCSLLLSIHISTPGKLFCLNSVVLLKCWLSYIFICPKETVSCRCLLF
jgi:hypothetical protein